MVMQQGDITQISADFQAEYSRAGVPLCENGGLLAADIDAAVQSLDAALTAAELDLRAALSAEFGDFDFWALLDALVNHKEAVARDLYLARIAGS